MIDPVLPTIPNLQKIDIQWKQLFAAYHPLLLLIIPANQSPEVDQPSLTNIEGYSLLLPLKLSRIAVIKDVAVPREQLEFDRALPTWPAA